MKKASIRAVMAASMIVILLLVALAYLPKISQLAGYATAEQEGKITIQMSKTAEIDLAKYFGADKTYLATTSKNLTVETDGNILRVTPDKGFIGERTIKVFASGADITEFKLRVSIVDTGASLEDLMKEEMKLWSINKTEEPVRNVTQNVTANLTNATQNITQQPANATQNITQQPANTAEPKKNKTEQPKKKAAPSLKKEIRIKNKKMGEKIEDEPLFEVYFTQAEKNNETLTLVFYHDSNKTEPARIDGNITYNLSTQSAEPFENVTLIINLDDGIVPEFELHVGDTSEKFKFGKKIPKVWLEGKQIKKHNKKGNDTEYYQVIDRDDDFVDVLIIKGNSSAYIKRVNSTDIKGLFRWVKSTVLTTEVFAAEPIQMEEAIITLPRTDDVTAVVECTDFDFDMKTCNGDWTVTGLPFVKTETNVTFTVYHFSGYGGGNIAVIDVQSYPTLYGNWTVRFNTTGTADLTISAVNGTNWSDSAESGYDLKFLEISCGNQTLTYSWINDSVFIPDYHCDELGYETSKVLTPGKHTLKFEFGTDSDYAYNYVFDNDYDMTNQDNISWVGYPSSYLSIMDWADVNGDDYADAIVGAFANNSFTGAVYILYGPQEEITDVGVYDKANVSIEGSGGGWFGSCIGSGDFNNDGFDDLVLGEFVSASNLGTAYIIYGQSDNLPSGSITSVANASITGATGYLGVSCDSADANGDGYDDLLIGERGYNATWLIYSSSSPLSGSYGIGEIWNVSWVGTETNSAYIVRRAGDVNNDGYEDILIGEPGYNSYQGAAYLVYGEPSITSPTQHYLPLGTNCSMYGEVSGDRAGWSVSSAGDVNNDGYDDFLVSAPYYDDDYYETADAGRAYLFYGGPSDTYNCGEGISLSSANATFTGIASNDLAGRAYDISGYILGGALSHGDFNADTYSDFLVGVYGADIAERTDNGDVVLYYGKPDLFSGNYYLNRTDANATFYGEAGSGSGGDRLCGLPTGMAEDVKYENIMMSAISFNASGSCPFAYAWDGDSYEFINDMYPSSMLWLLNKTGRLVDTSYAKSPVSLAPKDGYYEVKIREDQGEKSYSDYFYLMTIDHPSDMNVYPSHYYCNDCIYTTSNNLIEPTSCIDNFGNNCLETIKQDDNTVQKMRDEDYIIVDLGDLSNASNINLVLDRGYVGFSMVQRLEVKDENGTWKAVSPSIFTPQPTTFNIVGFAAPVAINMTGLFVNDNYEIRLYTENRTLFDKDWPEKISIDFIGVDTSEPRTDYTKTILKPVYAELQPGKIPGLWNDQDRFEKPGYALPSYYNESSVIINYTQSLREYYGAEPYGDVLSKLTGDECNASNIYNCSSHVITMPGDEITIKYDYTAPEEGMVRDFIFISNGAYNALRTEQDKNLGNPINYSTKILRENTVRLPIDVGHHSDEGKVYIMFGEKQQGGLTNCSDVAASNSLDSNITAAGNCFNITADSVVLDCKGYTITGDGSGIGIKVFDRAGVTLKNCLIRNFTNSIYLNYSNDTIIQASMDVDDIQAYKSNRTAFKGTIFGAVNITDSYNIKLQNSGATRTATYLGSVTAYTSNYSKDVVIGGNSVYINSSNAAGFNASANMTFKAFPSHHPQPQFALGDSTTFTNCTTSTDPACYSYPFAGYGSDFTFNTTHFTNYTVDNGTLACGDNILVSVTLTHDYSCSGDAFNIGADSIYLDCNGYSITGSATGTGINLNGRTNVNLINCTVSNFTSDVKATSSTGVTFIDKWNFGVFNFSSAGISFSNTTSARIDYINTSITADGTNLHQKIILKNNSAFVNSTAVPGLNTSANVTIRNVTWLAWNNATIEFDENDDGTFDRNCTESTDPACYQLAFTYGGDFVFNTTHFSNFRVAQGGSLACGVTLYKSTTLTSDLVNTTGNQICLQFGTDNIVLDCNGRWINSTGAGGVSSGYGVYNPPSYPKQHRNNITVKNCNFKGWTYNVYSYFISNLTIVNNTLNSSGYMSILLGDESENANISNNTIYFNTGTSSCTDNCEAIRFHKVNNSIIDGNYIDLQKNYSYGIGIRIRFSSDNNISNNIVKDGAQGLWIQYLSHRNNFRNNIIDNVRSTGIAGSYYFDPNYWYNDYNIFRNITVNMSQGFSYTTSSCIQAIGCRYSDFSLLTLDRCPTGIMATIRDDGRIINLSGSRFIGPSNYYAVNIDYTTTSANKPRIIDDPGEGAEGIDKFYLVGYFTYEKTNLGSINYIGSVALSNASAYLSRYLSIKQNNISVNNTGNKFNASALLTLNNLPYYGAKPQYNSGSGFVDCTPSTDPACTKFNYTGGTLVFNTTHFSEFRGAENGTVASSCGATINESTGLGSNLTQTGSGNCITFGADNIFFDCNGYWMKGDGNGYGVNANGRENITVMNCNIRDLYRAINLDYTNNSLVLNNNITNITENGIAMYVTKGNRILNNSIERVNTYDGIIAQYTNDTIIDNNYINNTRIGVYMVNQANRNNITNNNIRNSYTYDGITLAIASDNLVKGNTLYNAARGSIWVESNAHRNIIEYNSIDQAFKTGGIVLYDSTGTQPVTNNIIRDNNISFVYWYPINLYQADNNTVERNWLDWGWIYGILLQQSQGNNVTNNTWTNTGSYTLTIADDKAFNNSIEGVIPQYILLQGVNGIIELRESTNWTPRTKISDISSIQPNDLFFNVTGRPGLNKTWQGRLYSLYNLDKRWLLQKDSNDDGTYELCPECNISKYGYGEFRWYAPGFSSYRSANNTPPTQEIPILNATTKFNTTADNLTVYNQSTNDTDGHNVTNIINWYKDSKSLTVLNMPFDFSSGDKTANDTYKTYDYSGYNNIGSLDVGNKTLIDSCDANTSWTAPYDNPIPPYTSEKIEGTASLSFVKTNTSTTDNYHDKKFLFSINMKDKYVAVWVYVKDNTTLSKIQRFRIFLVNYSYTAYEWKDFDEYNITTGWNLLYFNTSQPTGSTGSFDPSDTWWIRLDATTKQATDTFAAGDVLMDYWFYSPTIPDGPDLVAGISGGAYSFDGTNDFINVSDSASLNLSKDLSVEAWIKPISSNGYILDKGEESGATPGHNYALYVSANKLVFTIYPTGSAGMYQVTSAANLTLNQWNHVAATFNNSTRNMSIYINGTFDNSVLRSSGSPPNYAVPLKIGTDGKKTSFFNGTIDEVRIYNQTLTVAQILQNYNSGVSKYDTIVPQETTTGEIWKACITPNDGIENGTTNCSNNITIMSTAPIQDNPILNSTSGYNGTNEDLTVYPQNVESPLGLPVKNITNWYMNGSTIIVLNMPFEGGSTSGSGSGASNGTTNDYSGLSNNGAVVDAQWSNNTGHDGWGAYSFNGSAWIDAGSSSTMNVYDMSFAAWIKLGSLSGGSQSIISRQIPSFFTTSYNFNADNADLGFSYTAGLGGGSLTASNVFTNTSKWYFVAATRKVVGGKNNANVTLKLFVDGQLVNSTIVIGGKAPDGSSTSTGIGGDGYGLNYFNGSIDDAWIFNRTLSDAQILSFYQNSPNVINSDETEINDTWQACLTPNDLLQDGITKCSNNLTVGPKVYPYCPGHMLDGILVINTNMNITSDLVCQVINITNTAYLTVNNSGGNNVSIRIEAENITIDASSMITASGNGYRGGNSVTQNGSGPGGSKVNQYGTAGGGNGGKGGNSYPIANYIGGTWQNSSFQPLEMGSGAGYESGSLQVGGSGGGAIKVIANILILNGNIEASGYAPPDGYYAGGGAGGSIYIITDNITGTGTLTANGGQGGLATYWYPGGGGGGGRIAVYYNTTNWTTTDFNKMSVTGGTAGSASAEPGETGTLAFIDVDDNNMFIAKGFRWQQNDYNTARSTRANMTVLNAIVSTNVSNLTINITQIFNSTNSTWNNTNVTSATKGSDIFTLYSSIIQFTNSSLVGQNYTTLQSQSIDITNSSLIGQRYSRMTLSAANITIDADSKINATDGGYLGGDSVTQNGSGPGGSKVNQYGTAGASNGGKGGDSYPIGNYAGGTWYNSSFQPLEMGSGAGYDTYSTYPGGSGGGAIKITATDALAFNGIIETNGQPAQYGAGGGAGGSIYITTNNITGTGTLTANGGTGGATAGYYFPGGGGGGGRIAVYYNTTNWTTTDFNRMSVTGGTAGSASAEPGEVGTLAFIDVDDNNMFIAKGFRWQQNDYNTARSTRANMTVLNAIVSTNVSNLTINITQIFNSTNSTWNNTNVTSATKGSDIFTLYSSIIQFTNSSLVGQNYTTLQSSTTELTNSNLLGQRYSIMTLSAANITIDADSKINASGAGYPGGDSTTQNGSGPGGSKANQYGTAGGGNGGKGGDSYPIANYAGGTWHNSSFEPLDLGSGAGYDTYATYVGGSGGGAIKITATNKLIFDGNIDVSGKSPPSNYITGGGAGGSIYITTNNITGTGTLTANGGAGGGTGGFWNPGGGGGGGRIAVYYNTTNWTTTDFDKMSVTGGTAGSASAQPGETGTLAFIDDNDNTMFIAKGFRWQQNDYNLNSSWFTRVNITAFNAIVTTNITNTIINATNTFNATNSILNNTNVTSATTGSNTYTIYSTELQLTNTTVICQNYTIISAANITMDSDSKINASGAGYPGGDSTTQNGSGPGGSKANQYGTAGGGNGGKGGDSYPIANYAGGTWHNSSFEPLDLGSGAGYDTYATYVGGSGGGAIKITATNKLIFDGNIDVSGKSPPSNYITGGGAGGSIYITTNNITGTGTLTANGGAGGGTGGFWNPGGGGGGGRIAVYYNTTNWTTTDFNRANAAGGAPGSASAQPGEVGTLAFIDDQTDDVFIFKGFRFQENDAVSGFISKNTFNSTDALVRFNGTNVIANATIGFNLISSNLTADNVSTASIKAPVIYFDENSTINATGRLDLTYSTLFSDTGAQYLALRALTLENESTSEIAWINDTLELNNIQANLSTNTRLSNNIAFVNSTAVSALNTTANITLYGVSFSPIKAMLDAEDDGTFIVCPANICTNISYAGNVFKYNVTSFTTYSSDEAKAACGDTIASNKTFNQNYTCNGTAFTIGADAITLDCAGHSITGNGTGYGIYAPSKSNITIQNCTIEQFSSGINFNIGSNNLFRNNILINHTQVGMELLYQNNNGIHDNNFKEFGMSTSAIYIGLSQNATIENNSFSNTVSITDTGGIAISGTDNSTIINNSLFNFDWGINNDGKNNIIANNSFVNCSMLGYMSIRVYAGSDNVTVENNDISGGTIGLAIYSPNTTIRNNNVNRTTNRAVEISGTPDGSIFDNNTFSTASGNGIVIYALSQPIYFYRNNISTVGGEGLSLQGNTNYTYAENNTISGTGGGIFLGTGSDHNTFKNNTLLCSGTHIYFQGGFDNSIIDTIAGSYNFLNSNHTTIEDTTYGKIKFTSNISATGTNLIGNAASDIRITNITVFVNSSAKTGMNVSANITMYGVTITSPRIYADRNDDGVFEERCLPPTCYNLSYSGGTFVFNSTHFTFYNLNSTMPPTQDTPILNSTYGTNQVTENLTVWPQNVTDIDGDDVVNITNWYVNGTSITVLNMPFDLNNNTFTKDYSPYGNNGTLGTYGPNWTNSGISGGAYLFDGVNSTITVPDASSLNITGDITLEVWVNLSSIPATSYILTKQAAVINYRLLVNSAGQFTYQTYNGTLPTLKTVSSTTNATIGLWYHVVATRNGSSPYNMSIYVNGIKENEINGAVISAAAAPLYIGALTAAGGNTLNGTLDEVRIYNKTLTPEQILENYNAGAPNYRRIVSQELSVGDIWQACLTPTDGLEDGITKCSNNVTILGPSGGVSITTTYPDINVLNYRLDDQAFEGEFETLEGECENCSYDAEDSCQLEQEVITGTGTFNMSLFLNGTTVSIDRLQLVCAMYAYANSTGGSNCTGSNDTDYSCAQWVGGGNTTIIDLTNSSNFNTSILLGNITPATNCSTVVCWLEGEWEPGDDQSFTIEKDFTVDDGVNNATNPNGTLTFTTDKYVGISTLIPDINVMNFQLRWQNFSGTFDTSAGTCIGCTYDLGNGTCQAEVEKIFGMFQTYNMTMELTTPTSLNFSSLNLICRLANDTVAAHSGCSALFTTYGVGTGGCANWAATAGRSTVLPGNTGVAIDLTNFTNINVTLGTISPRDDCKQVACELNGTWEAGNTQEFTINKTFTVTAV